MKVIVNHVQYFIIVIQLNKKIYYICAKVGSILFLIQLNRKHKLISNAFYYTNTTALHNLDPVNFIKNKEKFS